MNVLYNGVTTSTDGFVSNLLKYTFNKSAGTYSSSIKFMPDMMTFGDGLQATTHLYTISFTHWWSKNGDPNFLVGNLNKQTSATFSITVVPLSKFVQVCSDENKMTVAGGPSS